MEVIAEPSVSHRSLGNLPVKTACFSWDCFERSRLGGEHILQRAGWVLLQESLQCFFHFLNFWGHSPFCGATDTPVLDFWLHLPWVSKPGCIPCMVSHLCDPQIHLWYDTNWLYKDWYGSQAFLIRITPILPPREVISSPTIQSPPRNLPSLHRLAGSLDSLGIVYITWVKAQKCSLNCVIPHDTQYYLTGREINVNKWVKNPLLVSSFQVTQLT